MSLIHVDAVTKTYGAGESAVHALDGISFTIQAGEFICIMGESGAGKSTLLSVLGAMNRPTSGQYTVDGIDVYGLSTERQADFRREYLGFVFQSFHLIPYLNVLENVMLPVTTRKLPRKEKEELARKALQWVGLEDKTKRLPDHISGGEKERVAVARAIVNHPMILLADEPTGNLDSRNSREIMELLNRLNAAGMTIIMVTHSKDCAAFAQSVLNVRDGRLSSLGQADGLRANKIRAA